MVNHNSVGTKAEPFELVLELGKIREFARATWSTDPELTSGQHIPPTFLMVAAHWQPAEANALNVAGLDRRRSLHASQEFIFHGPPPSAGTRLKGESRVDRVYTKEGRSGTLTFVDIVTAYTDPDGRLVAESNLTGVELANVPVRQNNTPYLRN